MAEPRRSKVISAQSRCHTKNGKRGGRGAGTRSLFWHLPTTKAVAARTRGGHVLGGVAHGGVCFYIRIANTELEHKRHCHNTPRRCPCCLPRRCPRCQPPKRSARGCEAVMRRRCVRGLLPLASQCKCNLTHIVSRTQPSPLCFASRTSSSAPSHPPRRPRPRGCRAIYTLHCRRCVRWVALRRRGSDSAPPPGLRHAGIPPEQSISKSGLIDPEFEDPMVVFKIEGSRHKIVTPGDPSVTGGCFMSKVGAVVSLLVSVILGSVAARFSIFDSSMGLPATVRGGARTSTFSKPVALRGPCIAFGLRFITPSGVRSTPDTTGPGGPLP